MGMLSGPIFQLDESGGFSGETEESSPMCFARNRPILCTAESAELMRLG